MDLLNRITIKSRMILAVAVMLMLFAIFGGYSIKEMTRLGELESILYEHPLRVSNAALSASMGVIKMHRSMKDVALSRSELELHEAIEAVRSEEKSVYAELDIVRRQILGMDGKKLEEETRLAFSAWKHIRDEVIELVLMGDKASAASITKGKGADHVRLLERNMLELTQHARNKADTFVASAKTLQKNISRNTILSIAVIALISFLIAFFTLKSTLSSIESLSHTMEEITTTGRLKKSDISGNNEISRMSIHFNGLIDRLGDQFWLRDGQNSLAHELTGNLSFDETVSKGLNFVSRYVDACAGALYIYDSEQRMCRLEGSFAKGQGDFLLDEFGLGDGIVGQVAAEKKAILLDSISRSDAVINSGTLREPPKSIYTLPLIHEGRLYGVVEIAAFKTLNAVKTEYIDTAAQIISNALYDTSQNKQIKELLLTTQKANDELKAKTEELNRANEKLNATNQDLEAKSKELESMTRELKRQSGELQEQNIELEAQRKQVEEASRLKSEFLSNMSHELRTPLNSIMALSRVLMMQTPDKLTDDESGYLKIIERNGRQLLALINDILDLSKIEAGRMDIRLQSFSAGAIISAIVENLKPIAKEKGIRIDCTDVVEQTKIQSDETRVQHILQNIIGNAVKFTEEGAVSISIRQDAKNTYIAVSDTGIGIAKKDIPYIFDEFRQIDGSSSRKFEGTGLGLAIAYKASQLLRGDITVESVLGSGSTFTVTLPILWPEPSGLYYESDSGSLPGFSGESNKILIVDDDPRILNTISEFLNAEGYETIKAESGPEAIKLAEYYTPFAITLDILMPELDGWEVLEQLKSNPATRDIPVIVVSLVEDRETGIALGAVGHITKPVDRKALIAALNRLDHSNLYSVMVVDDNEFDRQQVVELIEEEGLMTISAESAAQCLELLKTQIPDVLILDLIMPGLDGFAVLEEVRSQPQLKRLPIIVVTAKDLTDADHKKLGGDISSIINKSDIGLKKLLLEIRKQITQIETLNRQMKEESENKQKKILLVEDSEAAVVQVKTELERAGYALDVARNGKEALAFVGHTIPDGIILDLMIPEINGFEVLEEIRSTSKTNGIPVLILTAKDLSTDDLDRLSHNNIQQLIQKGQVDREELLFKVRLMLQPQTQTESRAEKQKDRPAPTPTPTPKDAPSILVVEDNPDNMLTLKALLQDKFNILQSTDGKQGVEMVRSHKPDLVLLDISLPVMDGYAAIREVRKQNEMDHIPVIGITAHAMKGDRERIIKAGCNDYISKPIDANYLMERIDYWLNKADEEKR